MKKLILLLLGLALGHAAWAQEGVPVVVELSYKVGPTIDSLEKERHYLFPEFSPEVFRIAQIYKYPGGEMFLAVSLADSSQELLPFSTSDFVQAQRMVERLRVDYQAGSQEDFYVYLLDGTRLKARIDSVHRAVVYGHNDVVGPMRIEMAKVSSIQRASAAAPSEVVSQDTPPEFFPNPHDSRHFFAPTAYNLREGEGYFQSTYLFVVSFNYGFTDNFSFGAGVSLIPGLDMSEQAFMITPKFSFPVRENFRLGGGVLMGGVEGTTLGIAYGVSTFGSQENNITFGMGYGANLTETESLGLVMIGGMFRVSRRVSIVSENWVALGPGMTFLSIGPRLLWPKISFDIAMVYVDELGAPIPMVDAVFKFGIPE